MKTDICLKCPPGKEVHPISNLVKDSQNKRGYQKLCKPCHNIKCRAYYKTRLAARTENMYVSGVEQATRKEIMDSELPVWESRFVAIELYGLDITKVSDTCKIDRVLELLGL